MTVEFDLYPEIRAALIAYQPRHVPTDPRLDYCVCGTSWPCQQADQPWDGAEINQVRSLGDALLLDTKCQITYVLTVERADRPVGQDRYDLMGIRKILDAYGAPDVTPHPEGGTVELNLPGRLAFLLNPRNTSGFQRPLELLQEIDRLRERVAELEGRGGNAGP